mmetsp:Transcript_38052/g.116915  ORF Transcript_38052/g.116915 Transcript_38052/m.116915 type:complete len:268 (-) Transcript_38052:132-935(-)
MPRPKGCNSAASCSACAGESLTPSSSASSTTSPRSLAGLVASDARKASRSSPIEWRVVGTSVLRSASSAACTDQASRQGSASAARRMCAGDGPTVETHTQRAERANAFGCTSSSTARRTSSKLLSGSPIPIKTTFRIATAEPASLRACRACQTCSRISALESCACTPIVPVAQNVQRRPHPTCELTQTVQRCLPDETWSCRINTVSTRRPDASSTTSFSPPTLCTVSTTLLVTPTKASHSPAAASFGSPAACSGAAWSAPSRRKRCR